jgi:hypothetical protein
MKLARKIRNTGCLGALMVITILLQGYGQGIKHIKANGARDTVQNEQLPDKELLDKFGIMCKKIRDVKGNCTLAGVINIEDHANPAAKMENVGFIFCKRGDDFYYQIGKTATINADGVYIFIDHGAKKIMLSQKKQVVYNALEGLGDIGANIKAEHYKLVSKIKGDEQTISLINEHHISCKQYSLTFGKRDMKIKSLYLRLSNPQDPLRTDNEKIVNVRISEWDGSAELTKYLSKNNVIKNVNGRWKTVEGFKNYELIKM